MDNWDWPTTQGIQMALDIKNLGRQMAQFLCVSPAVQGNTRIGTEGR